MLFHQPPDDQRNQIIALLRLGTATCKSTLASTRSTTGRSAGSLSSTTARLCRPRPRATTSSPTSAPTATGPRSPATHAAPPSDSQAQRVPHIYAHSKWLYSFIHTLYSTFIFIQTFTFDHPKPFIYTFSLVCVLPR